MRQHFTLFVSGGKTFMPSLSIGLVFNKTYAVLKERWKSWILIIAAFSLVPSIIFELIRWQVGTADDSVLETMRGLPGEMLLTGLLTVCLNVSAARGVFDVYRGRASSGTDWITAISSLFWPCLGLSILINLGVILGLILLVIPGLFLVVMWAVALPARVAEGPTVDQALRRSAELTKGSRWQIFAIIVISTIAFFALAMVNGMVFIGPFAFVGSVVVYPIVASIAAVLMAVIPPVMYEELVALKGGRPDLTSEVFA